MNKEQIACSQQLADEEVVAQQMNHLTIETTGLKDRSTGMDRMIQTASQNYGTAGAGGNHYQVQVVLLVSLSVKHSFVCLNNLLI